MSARVAAQPDLFDAPPTATTGSWVDELDEHPGEEFIQRIRDDLHGLLAKARAAASFPWRDLTETYRIELHVNSMSNWLPRPEAVALRRAFAAEMDRLYEAADQARPEVWGADF